MNILIKQSFTLMEIMIVMILASIIAGTALVNYNRTIARSYEKDALIQLNQIRAGMEIYKNKTGGYPPNNLADDTAIDNALGTNVIENNINYNCLGDATYYDCRATSSYGWAIHSGDAWWDGAPHCFAGTCPTCTYGSPCAISF